MLLYSYFHPNTKPVQVTNTFPFNIENLSSSPLHIMGEIKPNLHTCTYELRLVIAHMTVYICLSLSNSLVFYLMTIEDTSISCLDLRVIKTHAHPTSCKHSHIKYNSDINSSPLRFKTAINLYCNQYYSAFGSTKQITKTTKIISDTKQLQSIEKPC